MKKRTKNQEYLIDRAQEILGDERFNELHGLIVELGNLMEQLPDYIEMGQLDEEMDTQLFLFRSRMDGQIKLIKEVLEKRRIKKITNARNHIARKKTKGKIIEIRAHETL